MIEDSGKKGRRASALGLIVNRVAEMKNGIVQQMESFIEETAALAVTEVRRLEEIKGSLEATVARLQAELREKDEMLRLKDSALKELEREWTAQIRDLEGRLAQRTDPREANEGAKDFQESVSEETKVKWIEQSMQETVMKPRGIIKRQAGQEQKKSRLASLLAPIQKRS